MIHEFSTKRKDIIEEIARKVAVSMYREYKPFNQGDDKKTTLFVILTYVLTHEDENALRTMFTTYCSKDNIKYCERYFSEIREKVSSLLRNTINALSQQDKQASSSN